MFCVGCVYCSFFSLALSQRLSFLCMVKHLAVSVCASKGVRSTSSPIKNPKVLLNPQHDAARQSPPSHNPHHTWRIQILIDARDIAGGRLRQLITRKTDFVRKISRQRVCVRELAACVSSRSVIITQHFRILSSDWSKQIT